MSREIWIDVPRGVLELLGVYAGVVTPINVIKSQKSPEAVWSLNYASVRMAAIVGLVELIVFLPAYRGIKRSRE